MNALILLMVPFLMTIFAAQCASRLVRGKAGSRTLALVLVLFFWSALLDTRWIEDLLTPLIQGIGPVSRNSTVLSLALQTFLLPLILGSLFMSGLTAVLERSTGRSFALALSPLRPAVLSFVLLFVLGRGREFVTSISSALQGVVP